MQTSAQWTFILLNLAFHFHTPRCISFSSPNRVYFLILQFIQFNIQSLFISLFSSILWTSFLTKDRHTLLLRSTLGVQTLEYSLWISFHHSRRRWSYFLVDTPASLYFCFPLRSLWTPSVFLFLSGSLGLRTQIRGKGCWDQHVKCTRCRSLSWQVYSLTIFYQGLLIFEYIFHYLYKRQVVSTKL